MFRLVNLLVFITFLYSTVYAQSDDDFLSDFGGDDFEEIESELDFVTTNVVKEKFSDISIEKKQTSESFDWDAIFSQKLYYGLESPSVPFLRRAPGIEAINSNINVFLLVIFNSFLIKSAKLINKHGIKLIKLIINLLLLFG